LITAEIDPLRSEGQSLGAKLEQAGVKVKTYDVQGVTHEFYGLGAVVADARRTQVQVAEDLKTSLAAAAPR
jgi:acetyl esterase/lipase